jgi:hypothetical protein
MIKNRRKKVHIQDPAVIAAMQANQQQAQNQMYMTSLYHQCYLNSINTLLADELKQGGCYSHNTLADPALVDLPLTDAAVQRIVNRAKQLAAAALGGLGVGVK